MHTILFLKSRNRQMLKQKRTCEAISITKKSAN